MSEIPEQLKDQEMEQAEGAESPKSESGKKKKLAVGGYKKEFEEMANKLIEMNDKYLRLSAEFDNYRKRTLKEKMDLTKMGGETVLLQILPVVDNLERAIQSIRETSDIDAVKHGIELIYANFRDFLKQNGIQEIECLNQDFNSDIHEALTKIPAPNPEQKGKVVEVIEKGYYLHDRVIRFARVVVGD
ncbi:MAG: nucleotide exchange factor GrpE [Porphyromonadaceae bacterium]|nr:MAG: nucleotide exchange factor GrpE [Porphyromonadaceae bacterium]